jgi:hypothetical protein
MPKHPLLQKKAGSGWNLCDPNGGVNGEGKTRDGLNKVLEQSKAGTHTMRLSSWKVTIRNGNGNGNGDLRTANCNAETYKAAEKAITPKLAKGETIVSMTVARKTASASPGQISAVLKFIKDGGPATTQDIAKGLGWSHEQAYGVLRELQTTGLLGINKMRWNIKLMASKKAAWQIGDDVKANMGNGQFFRGEIESVEGDKAVVSNGKLKKTVPLANLDVAHPVQFIPSETKSEPMGSMKPDDYCEACGQDVANRECAHGILCDSCDAEVHGEVGGVCEIQERHRHRSADEDHEVREDFIVSDFCLARKREDHKKCKMNGCGCSCHKKATVGQTMRCPSCKGSRKSEHPADIAGSMGGIRPPCRQCGGSGRVEMDPELEANPDLQDKEAAAADDYHAYECKNCEFAGDFPAAEKHEKETRHQTEQRVYDARRYKQGEAISGQQPCCGAFAPNHKPDCKTYNENFSAPLIRYAHSRSAESKQIVGLFLRHSHLMTNTFTNGAGRRPALVEPSVVRATVATLVSAVTKRPFKTGTAMHTKARNIIWLRRNSPPSF